MTTTIESSFNITGTHLNPEEVTRVLGITPSRTWRLGDHIQNTLIQRHHSGWSLSTGRVESLDVGEQIASLLGLIDGRDTIVRSMLQDMSAEAEVSSAIYIDGATPSVHLGINLLERMRALRAAFDVDIYVFTGK